MTITLINNWDYLNFLWLRNQTFILGKVSNIIATLLIYFLGKWAKAKSLFHKSHMFVFLLLFLLKQRKLMLANIKEINGAEKPKRLYCVDPVSRACERNEKKRKVITILFFCSFIFLQETTLRVAMKSNKKLWKFCYK